MQIFGERYLRGYLHALRAPTGWAARRGPAVAGLFRAAFLRTQRAPFDALGSPVTYAVIATRSLFSCRAHGGQQVPPRRSALRIPHGSLTSVTCARRVGRRRGIRVCEPFSGDPPPNRACDLSPPPALQCSIPRVLPLR